MFVEHCLTCLGLIEVNLKAKESYQANSKIITTISGQKYSVSTKAIGFEGDPFCAYFGIEIIGGDEYYSDRRVRTLDDFSANKKTFEIIFTAKTNKIRAIYRINLETEARAKCKYKLLPLDEITISVIDPDLEEKTQESENYFFAKTQLSEREEFLFEKNLVWIFGTPRSGTTWLAGDLLSHNTHFINEPKISRHLDFSFDMGGTYFSFWEYHQRRNDYIFSNRHKNTWKFYLRKLILNEFYANVQDLSKTVIIKEPTGFGFKMIEECFPNSKIIVILRDGRDVLDSQIALAIAYSTRGDKFGIKTDRINKIGRQNLIKLRAIQWNRIIELIMSSYENHSNNLKYLVRYEDLLKNTLVELEKIYKFLNININKNELEKIVFKFAFENIPAEKKGKDKHKRSATPGLWKENFSEVEKQIIQNEIEGTLKELGYNTTNFKPNSKT